MTRSVSILLVVYTLASFLHFSHNALFLAEYPNLPVWFTPLKIYAAWFGVAAVGLAGYLLLRFGQPLTGLAVLAVYGVLGLDGLAHYAVAPVSAHSLGMNLSIGFEVVTALALLVALAARARAYAIDAAALRSVAVIAVLASVLAGCTTSAARNSTVGDAATTPLRDLNLVQVEIPSVLAAAREAPYALPLGDGCAALTAEIAMLDEVLGHDIDAPKTEGEPGMLEKGVDVVSEEAMDTLSSTVSAVVPFRRWVRKLSGADRRSKDVAAAIAAGSLRRAFLKGVGAARSCVPMPPVPTP